MKKILILGSGTAGTMMSNHLLKRLPLKEWQITIVDQEPLHYYQPGFLFLPFGIYSEEDVKKPIEKSLSDKVTLVNKEINKIIPDENQVILNDDSILSYDILIIATGTKPYPQEVEGMLGDQWQKSIFDFYTFEGSSALRKKLSSWEGGKLVVHISEMPIKCPVAPLEFSFLADSFFIDKGIRDKVSIEYVTPLSGAFTKPAASNALGHLLDDKNIHTTSDFNVEKIEDNHIIGYCGRKIPFDLLVTVPPNLGDAMIERSGFGDEFNFVPTNKKTLQTKVKENIFAIGDATNIPTSKAGSVAHFETEILTENILSFIEGKELSHNFDGHANCFVETGHGKALLIDFNYQQEPVEGTFPFAGIGPLDLLKESYMNHMGKLAFKWIYWNMLLPGHHIPFVSTDMSKAGKKIT